MARSPEGRQKRARKLKARIASAEHDHFPRCLIFEDGKPCGRPTARADRVGLSASMCRHHQQHRQRHGSPFCKSPTAATLKPYLRAALSHIDLHHQRDAFIRAALDGLDQLMASAGEVIIVPRLRGLTPDQRARVALARLRDKGVKPARLLAIVLAVYALIEEAPAICHRIKEWRIVAIAKATHRLASGYHRRWELSDDAGNVVQATEMHAYPRSAGRILRILGEVVEREAELVIDHHLAAMLALKLKRYGPHPSTVVAAIPAPA